MCGIFGIVSRQPIVPSDFIRLAEANRHRGNLAFGYLQGRITDAGVETAVSRHPQPFTADLVHITPAHPSASPGTSLALGHIRAPTGGRSSRVGDVHPFTVNDMFLAHNGLLLNHRQFSAWQLFPDSEVDSQYILGGIQAHRRQGLPTVEAICATVSQLEGQQACWLWSQADSALFLWRVMSPIYYSLTNTSFSFSSSRYQQTGAEPCVRIETLLPEGAIFRLNPFTLTFEQAATFSYYSPYRI